MTLVLIMPLTLALAADPVSGAASPESRAVAYLAREVPAWPAENGCLSCHNSGVAASALYVARRLGHAVPDRALDETSRWLAQPEKWDQKRNGRSTDDPALMRVQFAAALAEAIDAGAVKPRESLGAAAKLVAGEQQQDGSWRVDADGLLGSPATLGTALATHLARRVLLQADARRYRDAVARADRWLRQAKATSVPDAAAVLLALAESDDAGAVVQRRRCLEVLRKAQDKGGGWGPYAADAAEPFDTALALLALARYREEAGVAEMIQRGRRYLVSVQGEHGGWPETTRPVGGVSYAQRVATTGWAAQALLATRDQKPAR